MTKGARWKRWAKRPKRVTDLKRNHNAKLQHAMRTSEASRLAFSAVGNLLWTVSTYVGVDGPRLDCRGTEHKV